jgi:hypothetical protein
MGNPPVRRSLFYDMKSVESSKNMGSPLEDAARQKSG